MIQFLGKHHDQTLPEPFVQLRQVHGNTTLVVREPSDKKLEADGMITDRADLSLVIRAADCQNFCIYHPSKPLVGALHVGWRGLLAGAIPAFFRVLHEEYEIATEELHVFAGPSLCTACAEFADKNHIVRTDLDPRYMYGNTVDLQRAATDQFLDVGIRKDCITRSLDCTRCRSDRYYSYRGGDAEAVRAGTSNFLVCTLEKPHSERSALSEV